MSERIRGSYDDALYKSTYTLLYTYILYLSQVAVRPCGHINEVAPHRARLALRWMTVREYTISVTHR